MAGFTKKTFSEIVNRRLLAENKKLNEVADINISKAKASGYVADIKRLSAKIKETEKIVEKLKVEMHKTEKDAAKAFPMVYFSEYQSRYGESIAKKITAQLSLCNYDERDKVRNGGATSEYLDNYMKELSYQISQFRLALECYGKDELAQAVKDFVEGKKVEF
jgi:hypothetical protein